jgi:hypothetical protein
MIASGLAVAIVVVALAAVLIISIPNQVEHFSFNPNHYVLALIGNNRVWQDSKKIPFNLSRTYEAIVGDKSVPLFIYDKEGKSQLSAKINPGHSVAYVFRDAVQREASANGAYASEGVYMRDQSFAQIWPKVFEGTPSASLKVQFKPKVQWHHMYTILHRLALFVRRSDDLWPAKAQWCQKVGAQVQEMDQKGRVDWTTVWRKKMADAGCSNITTFDQGQSLASRVRDLKPSVWLDATTYADNTWKDVSGNKNHVTEMQGVRLLRQQAGPDGVGKSFVYIGGGTDAGVRISKGWPSGKDYTFVHVTKYNGPTQGRIWNGTTGNWFSGHHGRVAGSAYHQGWLSQISNLPTSDWLMTVDQKSLVRFNAGAKTGSVSPGFSPEAVGINAMAGGYDTSPQWSSMPVQMTAAPNVCMDVSGVLKDNGTKVQTWECTDGLNQSWRYQPETQQLVDKNSGKCLDLSGGNMSNGNQLQIWDCDSSNKNQKWEVRNDGAIRKPGTDKCVSQAVALKANLTNFKNLRKNLKNLKNLKKDAASTANGTKVELWDCHGRENQKWLMGSRPQPPALKPPTHDEPSDWGVAEVLVFAGNLNAAQIQSVEAYLQEKYGM